MLLHFDVTEQCMLFESQLFRCVKFSRAEPRPMLFTMQLPWLLARPELESVGISQYVKLLNQNLMQEFTRLKSREGDSVSYCLLSEKRCMWMCSERGVYLKETKFLNPWSVLYILPSTLTQPLYMPVLQLNVNNLCQNTEYSHCHLRSCFPSSMARFFLLSTEL